MLWRGARRSSNVLDLRGRSGHRGLMGGGLGTIVVVLLALFFGFDPSAIIEPDVSVEAGREPGSFATSPADEETKAFISAIVGYTEDTWSELFAARGYDYPEPELILYNNAIRSACGFGQSAMGPFYCSGDQRVYLDMSFFRELHERFQAPGDFAQAYVIAHEIGHHVQNVTGTMERIDRTDNDDSVRLELQADCYAGVWANHNREFLEAGDVEEALRAASVIGDDKLQMQSQGYVVPETFTHGTSAQRMEWLQRGLQSGAMEACDTFQALR